MPKIRRWFNVSHDINSDPEVWELTERFGDRGLRAWLEILSIADRNDGFIPGDPGRLVKALSIKLNTYVVRTTSILGWLEDRTWLVRDPDLRVRNYWIFRYSRDRKKNAREPPHHSTSHHSTLLKNKEKIIHPISEPKELKWGDPEMLIKKYNEETPATLPAVEKITPARLKKAREYLKIFPDEAFWTDAFKEIGKSQFLQGLRNGNGHGTFIANFDWLLTKGKDGTENVVKIFEGRYGN